MTKIKILAEIQNYHLLQTRETRNLKIQLFNALGPGDRLFWP